MLSSSGPMPDPPAASPVSMFATASFPHRFTSFLRSGSQILAAEVTLQYGLAAGTEHDACALRQQTFQMAFVLQTFTTWQVGKVLARVGS